MNLLQMEEKKVKNDGVSTCYAIRRKEEFAKKPELEIRSIKGDQAKEWRKNGYQILRVADSSFKLDFEFKNLKSADREVNAKLAVTFRILPNQALAEFVLTERKRTFTDDMLKDELLSSRWDLRGMIRQCFAGAQSELLVKYGKSAIDWSGLGAEIPSWLVIERIASLETLNVEEQAKLENFNKQMDVLRPTIEADQKKNREPIDFFELFGKARKKMRKCLIGVLCSMAFVATFSHILSYLSEHYMPYRLQVTIAGVGDDDPETRAELVRLVREIYSNNKETYSYTDASNGSLVSEEIRVIQSRYKLMQKDLDAFGEKNSGLAKVRSLPPKFSLADGGKFFYLQKKQYVITACTRTRGGSTPIVKSELKIEIHGEHDLCLDIKNILSRKGFSVEDLNEDPSVTVYRAALSPAQEKGFREELEAIAKEHGAICGRGNPIVIAKKSQEIISVDLCVAGLPPEQICVVEELFNVSFAGKDKKAALIPEDKLNELLVNLKEKGLNAKKVAPGSVIISLPPRCIKVYVEGDKENEAAWKTTEQRLQTLKASPKPDEDGKKVYVIELPANENVPSLAPAEISVVQKGYGIFMITIPQKMDMVSIDVSKLIAYTEQLRVAEKIAEKQLEKSAKNNDGNTIEGRIAPAAVTALRKAFEDAGFEVAFNTRGDKHNLMLSYTPPLPPIYVYKFKLRLGQEEMEMAVEAAIKAGFRGAKTKKTNTMGIRFIETTLESLLNDQAAVQDQLLEAIRKTYPDFEERRLTISK